MSVDATLELMKQHPDAVWEIAPLLPVQGAWTEEEYIWLTNRTRQMVEFSKGRIEVLPMPTDSHQAILGFLFRVISIWLDAHGGIIRMAGLRVRIQPHKFREPDLVALLSAADPRRQNAFWIGADLAVEIVSPDDPQRDLVKKRREYAEAGIKEYWIVHPQTEIITVLRLENGTYQEHGIFHRGDTVTSPLLVDFTVSVNEVLDAQ